MVATLILSCRRVTQTFHLIAVHYVRAAAHRPLRSAEKTDNYIKQSKLQAVLQSSTQQSIIPLRDDRCEAPTKDAALRSRHSTVTECFNERLGRRGGRLLYITTFFNNIPISLR